MNNDPFNPTSTYEPPKGDSKYLKLKKGQTEFLPASSPVIGWQYWTNDNKPARLTAEPKGNLAELPNIRREDNGTYKLSHFWAFPVIDAHDDKVKILEITQKGIQNDVRAYIKNPRWGSPIFRYTLTINREGDGFDTKHTVMANPLPDVPADWLRAWEEAQREGFNLNELFDNGDPFNPKTVPTTTAPEKNEAPQATPAAPATAPAATAPEEGPAEAQIREDLPADTATPPN